MKENFNDEQVKPILLTSGDGVVTFMDKNKAELVDKYFVPGTEPTSYCGSGGYSSYGQNSNSRNENTTQNQDVQKQENQDQDNNQNTETNTNNNQNNNIENNTNSTEHNNNQNKYSFTILSFIPIESFLDFLINLIM